MSTAMEPTKASGSTACRPCATAKARCIFLSEGILPNGKCTRCNRLNKHCILQTPAARRRRKSKSIRVPQLDEKLCDNANLVKLPEQTSGALPNGSSPALPVLTGPSSAKQRSFPSAIFSGPSAFFGATSFSAVFNDHRDNFEEVTTSNSPSSTEPRMSVKAPQEVISESNINSDLIKLGVKVLMQIPAEDTCNVLFSRHVNPNDGWIRLAGERLCNSIWPTYGYVLAKTDPQELEPLARLICRNTNSELLEENDPIKWFVSFSGINLRWEALGILFTYWSFGTLSSKENDSIFATARENRKERRDLMIAFKECAASCIALCSHTDHGNPFLVYLLYKHSLLETMISGDASLIYWRQHGDLCSMTTALGKHRDVDQGSKKVTISSEMRRRTYAAVFNIDKVIATFTGRPPMLSHRYSSTPLPLDLRDDQLLADSDALSKTLETLDARGWNTDGQIYSTTILRARTSFSMIRGEILDISLCPASEDTGSCISNPKQRSTLTYFQLPAVIVCHQDDFSNPEISSWTLYSRLLTRLEHLQNLFLLERLLIKKGHATARELIDINREMLGLTYGIWKEQERLTGLHGDFEWLIMYHAVPASGIICVELLKQIKDPSYSLIIPRSDSIQLLIMFVGFLDWVKPAAPNYDLCRRIREIIGRVLDQVLESPKASFEKVPAPSTVSEAPLDFSFDTDLRDFDDYATFDLLDTFDWFNESWVTHT